MYKCFLEIAYEAEALNTGESEELLELSAEMCNEVASTRNEKINELRQMIYDRGECHPVRTDDEFLLRFLRCKSFIVPRAHKLLVRYCTFREQHKSLYEGVDLWGLMKAKGIYEGSPVDRPDVGRLTVLRIGQWDPNEISIEDVMSTALAMVEIGIRQPKLQVLGCSAIIDCKGMTMRHISAFTPSVAYQVVCLLGLASPGRLRGCHMINYSWLINSFWYLIKQFIPQQSYNKIHFHGSDLESLHKHIDPSCLHPRYGGTCRSTISVEDWLKKLKKYRDEKFDSDMKQMGYIIKE